MLKEVDLREMNVARDHCLLCYQSRLGLKNCSILTKHQLIELKGSMNKFSYCYGIYYASL